MPLFSISVFLFVFILSFFSGFIFNIDAYTLDASSILLPPSFEHIFGTDRLGRDIFARIVYGGQTSLIIGFASAFVTTVIGFLFGSMAGFFRGFVDKSFIVIVDLFLTFPTFFLLLTLVSYVNASTILLIFIISITGWMGVARLIRSESFKIFLAPYIKILNIAKVSKTKILFKYYAPLLAPIFLVSFTFSVAGAILAESGLSFLGLGVVPPQISWGTMLNDGKSVIQIAWWVSFFPGLMIFLVTYSLINISNYIQQKLNQKSIEV